MANTVSLLLVYLGEGKKGVILLIMVQTEAIYDFAVMDIFYLSLFGFTYWLLRCSLWPP